MKFGRVFFFVGFAVVIVFNAIAWNAAVESFFSMPSSVIVKDGQVDETNLKMKGIISPKINTETNSVDFMLFDTLKVHTAKIVDGTEKVYLGGDVMGYSYESDGVLVVGNNSTNSNLCVGDVIKEINETKVDDVATIGTIINSKENLGNDVNVKIVRKGKELNQRVKPAYDVLSKKYKLGVWARNDFSGLGTVTFVTQDGKYGALGHAIVEPNTGTATEVKQGELHKCCILGVKRASRGAPGEIKGVFMRNNRDYGTVIKNSSKGVFGQFNLEEFDFSDRELIEIGGKQYTKPGKAYIYSCIDGKNIRKYEIEIIKTNYQLASSPKNLVFKVTDKRLIEATGGIVQGMSGSPIVQGGKLIGAVTHVFVNDATKGFGSYIDNMLTEEF